MPTATTAEQHSQSPTNSSSRSESFTDETSSTTGSGIHVSSNLDSQESDLLDWDPIYSEEVESESLSHPHHSQHYRSTSRPPSLPRGPNRRHTTSERSSHGPSITRVHRQAVPRPPSAVESEDWPGYGRGYSSHAPPEQYARRPGPPERYGHQPYQTPSYASAPNPFGSPGSVVPFAPPFNPYPPNQFPPNTGYYPPQHPMSGTPVYGGHDMMMAPYGQQQGYGYPPGFGMQPGAPQGYFPQYIAPETPPPSNPEVDKKLASLEKLMQESKLESDKKAAAEKKSADDAAAKVAHDKQVADEVAIVKAQVESELKAKSEAEKKAADEKAKADEAAAAATKAAVDAATAKLAADAAAAAAAAQPKEEKKKPIKFKDAIGRKFSFPFHLCQKWAGMEGLIRQAFLHVETIGPFVADGHYDLIGPNGEIILPQVWETMVEPDWSITMHLWPVPEPPKALEGVDIVEARHPGQRGHGRQRSGTRERRRGAGPLSDQRRSDRPPPPPPLPLPLNTASAWIDTAANTPALPQGVILVNDNVPPPKKKKPKSSGGLFGFGTKKATAKGSIKKGDNK